MKKVSLPLIGEIVVVKVTRILNYGAFVELLEHENQSGFVHISEIASRWTKNIRNHVKDNQIRVAKVLAVNPQKRQIDLSLIKVSRDTERVKLEEFKQKRRCQKLLEVLAKKKGVPLEQVNRLVGAPLSAAYESLSDAFTQIALDGATAATGVAKEFIPDLVDLATAGFSIPEKSVEATVFLQSMAGDGLDRVKKSLSALSAAAKGDKIEVFYTGSGKYAVRAFALDYKSAEKLLNTVCSAGVEAIESFGGVGKFEKVEAR